MPERMKTMTDLMMLGLSTGLAAICGFLSYLVKVNEGKKFSWFELFLHIACSAVFGLISYEIFAYEGCPAPFAGALSGICGWLGTRVARIGEILICRKLDIKPEELDI